MEAMKLIHVTDLIGTRALCPDNIEMPYFAVIIQRIVMHLRTIWTGIIFFWAGSVVAQQVTMQFFTTQDGLSYSPIRNAVCDDRGMIWFATDAPNRFDGREFLNYNNRSEPIFQRFKDISSTIHAVESCLYFWEDNVLVEGNTVTGQRRVLAPDTVLSPAAMLSTGTCVQVSDKELILFFLHADYSAFDMIRFAENAFTRVGIITDAALDTLYQRPYAFASGGGCLMYEIKAGRFVAETNAHGKVRRKVPVPGRGRFMIAPGRNNSALLLNDSLVYTLEAGSTVFQPHPVNAQLQSLPYVSLRRVLETTEGDLWLSGEFRNLYFFDHQSGVLHDYRSQVSEMIPYRQTLEDILLDPGGVLWVCTSTGMLKVTPQRNWFHTYAMGIQPDCQGHCSFRGMTEDVDGLIYASFYSNIFRIDPHDRSLSGPVTTAEFTPYDLMYHAGRIITNQGLVIDPVDSGLSNPYGAAVLSSDQGALVRDDAGRVWWSYVNEVFYLDEDSGGAAHWVKVLDAEDLINEIVYDEQRQCIWLVSLKKLMQYRFAGEKLELIGEHTIDPTPGFLKLHCGEHGNLWLATESGLARYNPRNEEYRIYTVHEGLSNNLVVTILPEGDSCLWLGTHNGLSRFSIENESFINFYVGDGLANNEFNRRSAFLAADGCMYFGGVGGLTSYYPSEVLQKYYDDQKPGHLVLTSYSRSDTRNDSTVNTVFLGENNIEMYPHNKSLRCEYFFTNYNDADNIQYSYRLEGIDHVWSTPSLENFASFNYLPAGNYTLAVRAKSGQGQWYPQELSIPVLVYPPWYATWWAYCLYALVIIAAGFAIFQVQKKRWKLRSDLQLKQAEADNLKKLDSFKSKLYTNITHEFRTPLTVILGMARKIREPDRININDAAQLIENNGQSLLHLVNQLLDLSKLENHAVKLQLQYKDIVNYIQYITQSFQSYANSQNISLKFNSTVQSLATDFDPERLKQVLVNLISNALKFTEQGGDIKVLLDYDATNASVTIRVEDNGIGIFRDDLPHIFDRFYQADSHTKDVNVGSGIGLAHARELVKLMGGRIEVVSEQGSGSTFTVTLPVAHSMQAVPAKVEASLPDNGLLPSPVSSEVYDRDAAAEDSGLPRLLIIEDNADVVFYLKSCVSHLYDVSVAYNGRIGIEMALQEIPDLIISDIMMPEADGFEVCDTLKNDVHTSHIPIILLTAKVDTDSRISGLKRGADAYLQKPFDQEELIAILENMIAMRKRWAQWYAGEIDQPGEFPEGTELSDMDQDFIARIHDIVAENYADENFSLPQLCQKVGMSRSQLFRKMKAMMDVSPSHYLRRFRLERAKQLLETGELNVSQVAWQVGFRHVSHFSKSYQEEFGTPPSATHK